MLEKQFRTVRIEVGGIDFSVWKIHLKALHFPEVGNTAVLYPDLGLELKVIPLNTLAKRSIVNGLHDVDEDNDEDDETENDQFEIGQRKQMVLTNEVKKVGVIIDRS